MKLAKADRLREACPCRFSIEKRALFRCDGRFLPGRFPMSETRDMVAEIRRVYGMDSDGEVHHQS